MKSENSTEQPTSPYSWLLDEGRDTKAITLRLDKTWIQKLDKLAYRISNHERVPMTKQLLIQMAIWEAFVRIPLNEILKRFYILSEGEQVALARQTSKQSDIG